MDGIWYCDCCTIILPIICLLFIVGGKDRGEDGGREFEEIEENLISIIVGEERCREFREFDRLDREVFNLVES